MDGEFHPPIPRCDRHRALGGWVTHRNGYCALCLRCATYESFRHGYREADWNPHGIGGNEALEWNRLLDEWGWDGRDGNGQ